MKQKAEQAAQLPRFMLSCASPQRLLWDFNLLVLLTCVAQDWGGRRGQVVPWSGAGTDTVSV